MKRKLFAVLSSTSHLPDPAARGIMSLVAVHRLREVACLYGFTRFEPAPLATDELEDVGLAVSGAPLAQTPEWLPAVEQFGEGFFLQFAPEALAHWLSQSSVLARARQLQAGATAWINAKRARGMLVSENSFRERERPEYVMAHSLAHALMSEVALDCGYPASALKERLYVLPRVAGQPIQCGICAGGGQQWPSLPRPLASRSRSAMSELLHWVIFRRQFRYTGQLRPETRPCQMFHELLAC